MVSIGHPPSRDAGSELAGCDPVGGTRRSWVAARTAATAAIPAAVSAPRLSPLVNAVRAAATTVPATSTGRRLAASVAPAIVLPAAVLISGGSPPGSDWAIALR